LKNNVFTMVAGNANQHYTYANGQQIASNNENGFVDAVSGLTAYDQGGGDSAATVQSGDTLLGLAQRIYGNSSLWYVLASANAIASDNDLVAGTTLRVPNVTVAKNDASTFKPYNPEQIIGPTTPGLPYVAKPGNPGCSMVATLIRLVAVILAIYAPPVGAAIASGLGETIAQTAEIDDGIRQGYDVGGIVMAGVTAGYGSDLPINQGTGFGFRFLQGAEQAIEARVGSFAINKALGRKDTWNWSNLAVSAVSSGLGNGLFGPSGTAPGTPAAPNPLAKALNAFNWTQVAKLTAEAVARTAITYGVEKAFTGEAHWAWSSVANTASSDVASAWARSGVFWNRIGKPQPDTERTINAPKVDEVMADAPRDLQARLNRSQDLGDYVLNGPDSLSTDYSVEAQRAGASSMDWEIYLGGGEALNRTGLAILNDSSLESRMSNFDPLRAAMTGDFNDINYSPLPKNGVSTIAEVMATRNGEDLKFQGTMSDILRRFGNGDYFDFRQHAGDELAEINGVTSYLRSRSLDAPNGLINPRLGDRDPCIVAMRLAMIDPEFAQNFAAGGYKHVDAAMAEKLQYALVGRDSSRFADVYDSGLDNAIRLQVHLPQVSQHLNINDPISEPIPDAEFVDSQALSVEQIRAILQEKNPALVTLGLDTIVYDTAQTYGLNPKVILATLAQEQNWGRNGKLDKLMGVGGGKGSLPVSLGIVKSIEKSASTYSYWFAQGQKNIPELIINYDPTGKQREAAKGSALAQWESSHAEENETLNSGYAFTPRTASEYAKLKYTPFTYFAPQGSRPYDLWVNFFRGF